jgi:hypothetical protein
MTTTPVTATNDLQSLLDERAITRLVGRLGVCLDEGRFDEMAELLTADATVRTPGGTGQGRDMLVAQARRNHPTDQRFQHATSNVLIDVDGDRAAVRANLVVHIATPHDGQGDGPAPALRCSIGEIYRFTVVRTPDGWRFADIETDPRWLSGTLPTPPGVARTG